MSATYTSFHDAICADTVAGNKTITASAITLHTDFPNIILLLFWLTRLAGYVPILIRSGVDMRA